MTIPDGGSPLRALLRSEPLDHPPILLWKHFRIDEPRELARRTVAFYRDHRLAAAKLMPDIPLLFRDHALSSWAQVAELRRFGPIATVGRAAEYVRTVELVRAELDAGDVVLVTLFSPLALVGLWTGPTGIREMANAERSVAHAVLWALAGVVSELAAACLQAGADGVYYSCWGQDVLSASEYGELGTPYDLAGLRGAGAAEFRLLHLHGAVDGGVERYATYPAQIVGWSEVESSFTLTEGARALPGKFVMGGIAENRSGPADAATRARIGALVERLGPRFVVAPGCSLPDDIGDEALASLRALAGFRPPRE
ncbi:MAG: uroporphyrinogen decarboxylase family protein [Candidatus Dormibacteria bacterium]